MRVLLILLLVTAGLAGCSDTTDDTTDPTTTSNTSTSSTSSTTTSSTPTSTSTTTSTTAPPEPNNAPTAALSATTEDGTFNVTFDIDGADEDGDVLSWSLDADGDGTADAEGEGDLPAQYVHDFGEAGNYTATLTVSDGEDDASESVDLVLEADGASAGQSFDGGWATGAFGCGIHYNTIPQGAPSAGTLYAEMAVAPETIGTPYRAAFGSLETDELGGAISFYDADEAFIDGALNQDDPVVVQGLVPDGAVYAVFSNCGAQGSDVSYVAGPDVAAPPA